MVNIMYYESNLCFVKNDIVLFSVNFLLEFTTSSHTKVSTDVVIEGRVHDKTFYCDSERVVLHLG